MKTNTRSHRPDGFTLTQDGYLRCKKRGPFRDQLAHRMYAARCIGRALDAAEEVHHLCRNRACWPPSDFHLCIMSAAIHHGIDAGRYPTWKHRKKKQLDRPTLEV
jgi:hypothetical protein